MFFFSEEDAAKTALHIGEERFSFADLQKETAAMAERFKKLPKAILILKAEPEIGFITQFLAAMQISQPVALFSNTLSEEEQQARIALLGRAMTVDANGDLEQFHENSAVKPHAELALILFTSGTTGHVKAVQLSARNIKSNCLAVIKALRFDSIQDQLLFLPLSYSFGLLGQLLPGLMTGITTRLIAQFTEIKSLLETAQVPQMWSGVPSHWVPISKMAALYPEGAGLIKAVVSAGAPLPVPQRMDLKRTFPNAIIYNNYGLTEASPRVLTYSSDNSLFMEQYAGYPVGDWQVQLSAEDELLIRGSQMMLGYLGDEQNTKIHQGWLHTGDIAEILPDGLIAIKGRRDNLVNIGGEKVNLTEIEEKICQMEGIKEVIILPLADDLYGVRLVACFETGSLPQGMTEPQLTEQIQNHLLPKKLPVTVRLLPHLPRNHNGKLDRKTLLANSNAIVHKESHHAQR
ncbi:class I adenylate-forming enzyme family protein [Legionella shakespearei]|uniref:Acyl CoA ligase n=1 Tax=Legionella shakespearei DSM 23087 TaxID=1122169 RepID=A0A0W0Z0M6_9GAMM|nr:class I adenylate-forming enzyme family protein [Legionella shakespearei]KTD62310.1 acyl CoA ligase [Legionella shakespearei DSM 23087]